MMNVESASITPPPEPRWRPLDRTQRRVLGVLAEKAKTTPDNYPLSLNALVNGCNQKSNRAPQMQLEEARVDEAIDELRLLGAMAVIQGDGRVEKYRHLLYDWLGVDKVELAVMAELLLRGAQWLLGELRGRAARMEPIAGIAELRPIVDRLQEKKLLLLITPPGRGCIVTHNLYQPEELAKVRAEHGGGANVETASAPAAAAPPAAERIASPSPSLTAQPHEQPPDRDLLALREQVAHLKREQAELREELTSAIDAIRSDVDDLKRQLGV